MRRSGLSIAMVASILLCSATHTIGQQLCQPALTLTEARTSDVQNQRRIWTSILNIDASRCSTSSGQFQIQFTRVKEYGPDLQFAERFGWRSGQTEVSLDIWWDEWLQDYRVSQIEPCPCRD